MKKTFNKIILTFVKIRFSILLQQIIKDRLIFSVFELIASRTAFALCSKNVSLGEGKIGRERQREFKQKGGCQILER